MRVLLDENIDRLLKDLFADDFDVWTVHDKGWDGLKNGVLLKAAEQEFDVFVTMDRNLEFQQNLSQVELAIVVLRSPSNAYPIVAPLIPKVNEVLRDIQVGELKHVSI